MDDPWVTSLTPAAMGGLLTYPCGVVAELTVIVSPVVGGHQRSFCQAPCRGHFGDLAALDGDFVLSLACLPTLLCDSTLPLAFSPGMLQYTLLSLLPSTQGTLTSFPWNFDGGIVSFSFLSNKLL